MILSRTNVWKHFRSVFSTSRSAVSRKNRSKEATLRTTIRSAPARRRRCGDRRGRCFAILAGRPAERLFQVAVHRVDRRRPFAGRDGQALHRPVPHVARDEDTGDARLERVGPSFEWPVLAAP
jgi:hypothetical protein